MTATGDGAGLAARSVLAEALFCSALRPSDRPSTEEVRRAVRETLLRYGADTGACGRIVAQRLRDEPAPAADRMRWCRNAVALAYPEPSGTDDAGDGTEPMAAQSPAYLRELFWRRAYRP